MSIVETPVHMVEQKVITHTDVNNVFLDLKNNTDGTTSKINDENLRTGALDREHLADNVFLKGASNSQQISIVDVFTANSANTGDPIVATTVRTNTGLQALTLKQGEVLRYGAEVMFRAGPRSSPSTFVDGTARVEQQVYLSVWFRMSPTNGASDYWLKTNNFGFSITGGPYSFTQGGAHNSQGWIQGAPDRANMYLRQCISGALIFPNAQEANVLKIVLKCHVENDDNTAYLSGNKVWGMIQTN